MPGLEAGKINASIRAEAAREVEAGRVPTVAVAKDAHQPRVWRNHFALAMCHLASGGNKSGGQRSRPGGVRPSSGAARWSAEGCRKIPKPSCGRTLLRPGTGALRGRASRPATFNRTLWTSGFMDGQGNGVPQHLEGANTAGRMPVTKPRMKLTEPPQRDTFACH